MLLRNSVGPIPQIKESGILIPKKEYYFSLPESIPSQIQIPERLPNEVCSRFYNEFIPVEGQLIPLKE